MRYTDTEAYIEGEYDGEVEIVKAIIERHSGISVGEIVIRDVSKLAMDITGYYTGCLAPDGSARVSRRRG